MVEMDDSAFPIRQSIKGDVRSYGKKHEKKYWSRKARKLVRRKAQGIG